VRVACDICLKFVYVVIVLVFRGLVEVWFRRLWELGFDLGVEFGFGG